MASITGDDLHQHIYDLTQPLIDAQGLEFIDLKVTRHGRDVHIEMIADKPTGGISIHACSVLNKALVEAIDQSGCIDPEGYTLEVASPGLDRPLTTLKDFTRYTQREVHCWLKEPVDGKKEIEGVITAVTPVGVVLLTTKNKEMVVPLEQVIKGMLVI